ncbi:hypothetical protein N7516_008161 [Penicillium verrucosum]|uniref:uncharacterized protein n=1 Tax=Penicillium verrucosum TaxID=60171 RepID=UPI002545A6B3|nr:uncharacterized protein N7516_008161 [Penicillium verrucosum]KAJ5926388.1 hypothetical protein N7516_008161 [Penicillium verrucosum]
MPRILNPMIERANVKMAEDSLTTDSSLLLKDREKISIVIGVKFPPMERGHSLAGVKFCRDHFASSALCFLATSPIHRYVITQLFPRSLHGLAGGVSNTYAQLGISIGLNLTAILANAVTMSSTENKSSPIALAEGYSAAFWASFGATVAMILIAVLGMRTAGKVGRPKHD